MPIECCSKDYTDPPPRYIHPACAPLEIQAKDANGNDIDCLNYVRSALGTSVNCRFGPAIQV